MRKTTGLALAALSLLAPHAALASGDYLDTCITNARATGTTFKPVWSMTFESNTVLTGTSTNEPPASTSWYRDFSGKDGQTAVDTGSAHVWGGRLRSLHSILDTDASPAIATLTGPFGASTKAMHLVVNHTTLSSEQNPLYLSGISSVPDYYISAWYKYPSNAQTLVAADYVANGSTAGFYDWLVGGPEFKTGPSGDYRTMIELIYNGTKFDWRIKADNNANGPLPPDGAYHLYETFYNTTAAVPLGSWFHVEYFNHISATTGCTWFAVNGSTIFEFFRNNIGLLGAPINRIYPANPYSLTPMDVYVDNLVITEGMPSEGVRSDLARGYMPAFSCPPTLFASTELTGCHAETLVPPEREPGP